MLTGSHEYPLERPRSTAPCTNAAWSLLTLTSADEVIGKAPPTQQCRTRPHRPEGPKDKEYRRFKLSVQIVNKLKAHRDAEGLGSNDLLLAIRNQENSKPTLRIATNPNELGLTPSNEKGRQYKHGTLSGYGAGKCRCAHCKAACTIYRAQRRARGKDNPRQPRTLNTDGHIPNDWFRRQVWKPAAKKAGLGNGIHIHDLRHAHASWLLAGGADIQVVKERLGHGSIATTERYLHTLPDADETALDALAQIRNRSTKQKTTTTTQNLHTNS